MSIIHTLRTHKRKGMTTILGTLIFISILFTSIIPMQLSMLQTDSFESQLLQELQIVDDNKEQEQITVLAYPTTTTSSQLKIRIQNNGNIDVYINKIWIKNEQYSLDETINMGETEILGPYTVTLVQNTSYPITVITERGNIFSSDAGNMIFTSQGIWFTPSLGINVYIANDKGKYYVKVSNSTWFKEYTTKGQDFGDVIVLFEIETLGTYHVICKKNSDTGPNLPGTPVDVAMTWPNGSPIVFVYTSGLDT